MDRLNQWAGMTVVGAFILGTTLIPAHAATQKEHHPPITIPAAELDAETAEQIAALAAAKAAGDTDAVRALEVELGWHDVLPPADEDTHDPCSIVVRPDRAGSPLWVDDDVLVSDTSWSSGTPAMAVRGAGPMYVVVDDLNSTYLDLYESTDLGETWTYLRSIVGGEDLTNPAIAVGEGPAANRLLIAYEYGRETADASVRVYTLDLDTEHVEENVIAAFAAPFGPESPAICVDSPEYGTWYSYLVYNQPTLGIQDWHSIETSRTADYGATWTTPLGVAWGASGHSTADIDFGGGKLYVACSGWTSGPGHDVYVTSSLNFGATFTPAVAIADTDRDERDPRVAVTNDASTIIVTYTVDYPPGDSDIELRYSTDSGLTWGYGYWPFGVVREENADVVVSPTDGGRIHGTFWREGFSGLGDVVYVWNDQELLTGWGAGEVVNYGGTAVPWGRPTVGANGLRPQEGCVAWADFRGDPTRGVYFDASYFVVPVEEVAGASVALQVTAQPNPFNPRVRFATDLPAATAVTLRIHDASGRLIRTIASDGAVGAGHYEVDWDGRAADGAGLPSGVYAYELSTDTDRVSGTVVLVK